MVLLCCLLIIAYYRNALALLVAITKNVTIDSVVMGNALEVLWESLFDTCPLSADECMQWSEFISQLVKYV